MSDLKTKIITILHRYYCTEDEENDAQRAAEILMNKIRAEITQAEDTALDRAVIAVKLEIAAWGEYVGIEHQIIAAIEGEKK